MPLKTDIRWERLIKVIKVEHDEWGATRVLSEATTRMASEEYGDIPEPVRSAVPAVRTVERIIKAITREEKAELGASLGQTSLLDQPWTIAASLRHGLPDSALGDLLAVWKLTVKLTETEPHPFWTFTVRQAKWVVRLRPALPDAATELLLQWAIIYSRRERTAESQGQPLDTADLDAELAFRPWKSSLHEWEYEQAVLAGAVPPSRYSRSQTPGVVTRAIEPFPSLFGYFARDAWTFLSEVGGAENWILPWWPQAESVMAYWLREISTKVKKWQGINWGSGGGLPGDKEQEEWKAMGRKLAALVIAQAKALQEYEEAKPKWEKHHVESQRLFWRGQRLYENFAVSGRHVLSADWQALRRHRQQEEHLMRESVLLPMHPQHSTEPVGGRWAAWRPTELLREIGYDEKG